MGAIKTTGEVAGAGLAGGITGLAVGSLAPTTILGAFAGPIGLGLGVAAAYWIKGQAHWKANTFVKESQDPLQKRVAAIVDPLGEKRKAGTLTYADVQAGQAALEDELSSFEGARDAFSAKGGDQSQVVTNSRKTLDPIMAAWRQTFADDVTRLKPPDPEAGVNEKVAPTTKSILSPYGQTALGQAKGAADQLAKRSGSLQGRRSTILTGDKDQTGLAGVKKTLLGGGL